MPARNLHCRLAHARVLSRFDRRARYSGLALRAILDNEELKATAEDLTLVTGRRDNVEKAGLRGLPLTLASLVDVPHL